MFQFGAGLEIEKMGKYLRYGHGFPNGLRGYEVSSCPLHSQGVNEVHTNQDGIKVPSMLVGLLTMLLICAPSESTSKFLIPINQPCGLLSEVSSTHS